jgi:hypothetical protein
VHVLALLPGPEPVLVSGANDRTLRLWHSLSGRPLGTYHLPDAVRALTPVGHGDMLVAFGWERRCYGRRRPELGATMSLSPGLRPAGPPECPVVRPASTPVGDDVIR